MTYNLDLQQAQDQREANDLAAFDNYINEQPEYSLEEYREMLDETRAKLEKCQLKLKEFDVSTSGANILEIGYQDGLHGRQPRMPFHGNYRKQWERGFQDYVASGKFWLSQQEKQLNQEPF